MEKEREREKGRERKRERERQIKRTCVLMFCPLVRGSLGPWSKYKIANVKSLITMSRKNYYGRPPKRKISIHFVPDVAICKNYYYTYMIPLIFDKFSISLSYKCVFYTKIILIINNNNKCNNVLYMQA